MNVGCWNWRAEKFTDSRIGASPASCHALFCAHAFRITQSPRAMIIPLSSAMIDELTRINHAHARMLPAHECFHAHEIEIVNRNLRLIMNEKLRALQTWPQITFEHQLF